MLRICRHSEIVLAEQSVLQPNPVILLSFVIAPAERQELPRPIRVELLFFAIVQGAPRAQRVNDEDAAPIRYRCAIPGNGGSVEAQPAKASAVRTGARRSPVQLFRTIRAPCRSVIRAGGQRATAYSSPRCSRRCSRS